MIIAFKVKYVVSIEVFYQEVSNYLTFEDLSNNNDGKMEEVACAIVCCINENLVSSNYPRTTWGSSGIIDVTFRGFLWLENN